MAAGSRDNCSVLNSAMISCLKMRAMLNRSNPTRHCASINFGGNSTGNMESHYRVYHRRPTTANGMVTIAGMVAC